MLKAVTSDLIDQREDACWWLGISETEKVIDHRLLFPSLARLHSAEAHTLFRLLRVQRLGRLVVPESLEVAVLHGLA